MNINTITLAGRLTKDPEIKKVKDFDVCSFRIASNRTVGKDKKEKSIFIDIDAWGGQASACSKYLKKGSRVAVEGVLCQDTWDDKDTGKKNSKIFIEASNVMFLDLAEGNDKGETESAARPERPMTKTAPARKPEPNSTPASKFDDDDTPF